MKNKTESSKPRKLPREVVDENGDTISLYDKEGNPIKALSFLANSSISTVKTESDRLMSKIRKYRIMALCFFLAFVCFFCLFVLSHNKYNTDCETKFNDSYYNAQTLMETCISTDYDYETNFRELCGELNVVRKMAFAVTDDEEELTTLNNIYYLAVKLPEEYKKYLSEIYDGFDYIESGYSEKGYSILTSVIQKSDLLNY